jgi:DNA-entry nuclease
MKKKYRLLYLLLAFVLGFPGCAGRTGTDPSAAMPAAEENPAEGELPEYEGEPCVTVNGNEPFFSDEELTTDAFESYSEMDEEGRCGTAYACVGPELMPTEEREDIRTVIPSGWEQNRYDFVEGESLYNRCHLIGFQLTGENANEENLITGTRYMNVEGMLPIENMVADYIHDTGNHVMYRVTPVFSEEELVARGVLMEGCSVEDDEISFCVYAFNVQPGVEIDYETGENHAEGDVMTEEGGGREEETGTYILNISSKKFHLPDCSGVEEMKEKNKKEYTGSREELLEEGYSPCGACNP